MPADTPAAWTPEDVPGGLDRRVVRRLRAWARDGHEAGWHPGYGAHGRPDRLSHERARFERALGYPPVLARTHFLRWSSPSTFTRFTGPIGRK